MIMILGRPEWRSYTGTSRSLKKWWVSHANRCGTSYQYGMFGWGVGGGFSKCGARRGSKRYSEVTGPRRVRQSRSGTWVGVRDREVSGAWREPRPW